MNYCHFQFYEQMIEHFLNLILSVRSAHMVEITFSFCKFIYKFNIINKMEHKKILQKELIDRLKKIIL